MRVHSIAPAKSERAKSWRLGRARTVLVASASAAERRFRTQLCSLQEATYDAVNRPRTASYVAAIISDLSGHFR